MMGPHAFALSIVTLTQPFVSRHASRSIRARFYKKRMSIRRGLVRRLN
jgi:hypothetical protein